MKNTFVYLKEFISISQGKFHISLNVRTVHVFVYVLLNVEIALTVHTSKYGNFCDREVFTNFGKLKLVPKKRRKKKPKNNRLKKKTTDFVMHSELYCILGILSFFFFPAEITSTSTLLTIELKNGMSRSCYCL